MKHLRILLADDHSLMRVGLSFLINNEGDMTVCGEVADGEAAVEAARKLKPDLIIMDLMMPKLSGAEAARQILSENPEIRILVLTSFGTAAELAQAVTNGVSGVLLKDAATNDLVRTLREVANGKTVIPKSILELVMEESATPPLTERQQEILASVTRGLSNQEIAMQYGITVVAVKKHMTAILSKIGATTRAEAIAIAMRKHLLKI